VAVRKLAAGGGINTIELSMFKQAKLTVATGTSGHTPGGLPILLTLC
jgi:hypothetical protein